MSSFYQLWESSVPRTWVEQAKCKGLDPELFMPEPGGNARAAKAICNGRPATSRDPGDAPCPVRQECLDYAIQLPPPVYGVWGGKSERERRDIKRETKVQVQKRFFHGTRQGYEEHRRRGTPSCDACKEAHKVDVQAWRDRRRDDLTMPALKHLVRLVHGENARAPRTAV
jgi:WhiB family redox-sensing transcriptional regulator